MIIFEDFSGIMDDIIVEKVNNESWWFLVGLFNMEGFLTLLALYGNLLLLWTLKRYSVFHDHLRWVDMRESAL